MEGVLGPPSRFEAPPASSAFNSNRNDLSVALWIEADGPQLLSTHCYGSMAMLVERGGGANRNGIFWDICVRLPRISGACDAPGCTRNVKPGVQDCRAIGRSLCSLQRAMQEAAIMCPCVPPGLPPWLLSSLPRTGLPALFLRHLPHHSGMLPAAGLPISPSRHHEILQYLSIHFAATLIVLPNLIVPGSTWRPFAVVCLGIPAQLLCCHAGKHVHQGNARHDLVAPFNCFLCGECHPNLSDGQNGSGYVVALAHFA